MTAESSKSHEPRGTSTSFIVLLVLLIAILLVVVVFGIVFRDPNSPPDFNDWFSALSTLFSGWAFAGVIFAILLQRRELELQRQELRETRQELQRAATAQEQSKEVLAEQAKSLYQTAKLTSLSYVPAITLRLICVGDRTMVRVENIGSTPAYDAEIRFVGQYRKEGSDIESLWVRQDSSQEPSIVNMRHLRQLWEHDVDNYRLSDLMRYDIIPQRRGVEADLPLPCTSNSFLALFQFRDIQGVNYHQLYAFQIETSDKQDKFARILPVDPIVPVATPRIVEWFSDEPDIQRIILESETENPVSNFLDVFIRDHNLAIPSHLTRLEPIEADDRGIWYTL